MFSGSGVADVAAVADPNTGVAVDDSYGSAGGANWYVFGGTRAAAPIIAGVYALCGNTSGANGIPASLAYGAPAVGRLS
jgi:subtilase family serine protease